MNEWVKKVARASALGMLASVAVCVGTAPASQWTCRFLVAKGGVIPGFEEISRFLQFQGQVLSDLAFYLFALFLYSLIWCGFFAFFLRQTKGNFPNCKKNGDSANHGSHKDREKRVPVVLSHEGKTSAKPGFLSAGFLLLFSEAGVVVLDVFLQTQVGYFSQSAVWVACELAYWLCILRFASWFLFWVLLLIHLLAAERRRQASEVLGEFRRNFASAGFPQKVVAAVFFIAFLLFFWQCRTPVSSA